MEQDTQRDSEELRPYEAPTLTELGSVKELTSEIDSSEVPK